MKSAEKWTLAYGWREVSHGYDGRPTGQDLSARPAHVKTVVLHSLEAALHLADQAGGTWQEIRDPAGVVVMVTGKGFIAEACPSPSLCAKQLLNTRFPEMYPEAEMSDDDPDLVSHNDSETWTRVLLGEKPTSVKPIKDGIKKLSPASWDNLRLAPGPEDGQIEILYTGSAGFRAVVKKSALAIRRRKDAYDLVILKPENKKTRTVLYAASISQSVIETARDLGISFEEAEAPRADGLPKAWKPGLFKISWFVDGVEMEPKEVRGFVRGSLAIDRRLVEQKGYGDTTWKVLKWCLTHIPTGSGIVQCKARKRVEEIADGLREVVPEMTDGDAEVTEDIKVKSRAVLEKFGVFVRENRI